MIEIKISGDTPLEALASLSAFGLHCLADKDVSAAANRILEAERAKERKEAAKVSKSDTAAPANTTAMADLPADEPAPANPQASADLPPEPYVEEPPHGEPVPEPDPVPESEAQGEPAPTYTIEQIREKGTAAARAHGNPAVKAILKELGVPGMTALKKEQYPAFLEKLAALDGAGESNA